MKDFSKESLEEADTSHLCTIDVLSFCLRQLYKCKSKTTQDEVVPGLIFEELIGALLSAQRALRWGSRAEAFEKAIEIARDIELEVATHACEEPIHFISGAILDYFEDTPEQDKLFVAHRFKDFPDCGEFRPNSTCRECRPFDDPKFNGTYCRYSDVFITTY